MLLMGDEVRRTQRGNNNAYCQDSDISWFDWSLLERHGDIHRFVRALNRFRQRRDVVAEGTLSLNQLLRRAHIEWHGVALNRPDWSEPLALPGLHAPKLARPLSAPRDAQRLLGTADVRVAAGVRRVSGWRRCIDTALDSPDDICPWESAPVVRQATYEVQPRSVVVLALALEKLPEAV